MLKMAILLVMCVSGLFAEKILIITHAYNRPDFIKIQYLTLKECVLDDYELVVFNDAPSGKTHEEINQTCEELNIRCFPIPQEIHSHFYPSVSLSKERFYTIPSGRHADGIQYALNLLGFDYNGTVVLMDSDLFFIKPINISKLLEDCEIAAIMSPFFDIKKKYRPVGNVEYLWPGLVLMKMNQLPNRTTLDFSPGSYNNFTIDTGGHTYLYFKQNPSVRVKKLDHFHQGLSKSYLKANKLPSNRDKIRFLKKEGFTPKQIHCLLSIPENIDVEIGMNNSVIHYRGGSYEKDKEHGNRSQKFVDEKTKWVYRFIDSSLEKKLLNNL